MADHGEDEVFNVLRGDAGFGEELGGTEAELLHLGLCELLAGVNHHRKSA